MSSLKKGATWVPVKFIAEETEKLIKRLDKIQMDKATNSKVRMGNAIALTLTHVYLHGVANNNEKHEKRNHWQEHKEQNS